MKVLFIGDAGCSTGFERCTRAACDALHAAGHEVHVLGINHSGDPTDYAYPAYPAARPFRREDAFGVDRSAGMIRRFSPDVVCILQDPWNYPAYVRAIRAVDEQVPIVGWVAVDGANTRGDCINDLALAVFWTEYGEREARRGGFTGESAIVQLGVDLDIFRPQWRGEARERLKLPERLRDAFIVGLVGRNQPRKRLDLSLSFFAEWIKTHDVPEAVLFAHVAPTGDAGWDLRQLASYYGLQGRLLLSTPEIGNGVPEAELAWIYPAMDAYMTTTQGEGWGLPVSEAMACGVPCIVPDWSALGEWPRDAAFKVRCSEIAHTMNGINAVGGIADRSEFIAGLDRLYRDRDLRETLRARGLALVNEPRFRWENVGAAFVAAVESVVDSAAVPELAEVAD